MNKVVALHGFGGGGALLNFNVVNGTTTPTNPKENTIWVNMASPITSWYFGADEPNVYNVQPLFYNSATDRWHLVAPHPLREGDIINFTIPVTVEGTYEAIRIYDISTGKDYCVRQTTGSAVTAWSAGTKVSVRISNEVIRIGDWSGHGTAYLVAWEEYYHEEGTLWITTGSSSSVAFNALKKNGLKVYPISAKHYRSGVWVEKPAKIYQNGAWSGFIDWDTYLYRYDHPNNPAWVGLANTTVSTNDDGILIAKSTTMSTHCSFGMAEAIDVTNVSAIRIVYSSETNNLNNRFGVTNHRLITGDVNQYSTYVAAPTTGSFSTFKELLLDVSALSGLVYLSGCLVGTFYVKEVQKV